MKNLNHEIIRKILDEKSNKGIRCIDCPEIIEQYEIIMSHLEDMVTKKFSKHELAQWINSLNYYITLRDIHRNYNYKERSIIYVELGLNVGNEISYEHVAVVIKEGDDKVFIVPCSSSSKAKERFRNHDSDYILGSTEMGFPKETVIFIKDARWISKARIKSAHTTKVDPKLFDEIYRRVFADIFKGKSSEIDKQQKKLVELNKTKDDLLAYIASLNIQIEELRKKLDEVEKQRDSYYSIVDRATS